MSFMGVHHVPGKGQGSVPLTATTVSAAMKQAEEWWSKNAEGVAGEAIAIFDPGRGSSYAGPFWSYNGTTWT
jgi:hypothetical protein